MLRRYAITVEFELNEGAEARFMELIRDTAASSVREEPGCMRFDVLTPDGDGPPRSVLLYEIYEDNAAFRAHCPTSHFLRFDEASRPLVARKTARAYAVDENFTPTA